jgi:hypothetical protein
VSVAYSSFGDGSGFDLCGPQTYAVYKKVGNTNTVPPFLELTYTSDDPPQGVLTLQTSDQNDKGQHYLVIEVTLTNYSKMTEQGFSVVINDDTCVISDIRFSSNNEFDIEYEIADPSVSTIYSYPELVITPATCIQSFTY